MGWRPSSFGIGLRVEDLVFFEFTVKVMTVKVFCVPLLCTGHIANRVMQRPYGDDGCEGLLRHVVGVARNRS